jgi:hypothetical protein
VHNPKTDVTHRYEYVKADFVKHLGGTTLVIAILAVGLSLLFREPVQPTLHIRTVATSTPLVFEKVAIGDLNSTGHIATYGPPYNNAAGSVQSPLQRAVGVIHPVNPAEDFVVKPLEMVAVIDPGLKGALAQWKSASAAERGTWGDNYAKALSGARVVGERVVVPPGNYGPVTLMMADLLKLGQSGLMTGALDRSPADYTFDNQNSLLFLQGEPLHNAARKLELLGNQWGIIHEENAPYPGPWWMTIVTAIYQIPFIANASSGDALALSLGLLIFIALAVGAWVPFINDVPRRLKVYRLIWRDYYRRYEHPDGPGGKP